jgi:hypothetical protein
VNLKAALHYEDFSKTYPLHKKWEGSIIGLFPLEFEGLDTKSPFEGQYGSNLKP